jgi:nucleoside-diphosphate-sugar epimerase
MKKICITGANGFIGKFLCKVLNSSDRSIRGIVRTLNTPINSSKIEYVSVGDMNSKINWREHLNGFDCIIHCAGKAHVMNKKKESKDSNAYHLANTEVTKVLAEQAAEAGVKRLIFLSSVKVNGESTYQINNKQKFSHKDISNPKDPYAISKLEAEKALWEISSRTGLEVVVVRLPLVYGYGAKGNLARLIKLVRSRIPLPLSKVKNQRSMIGIDNLVDLLIQCIDRPEASGKTFLASDDEDLSTPELIELIASSLGRRANLFSLPIFVLKFLGSIFGKSEEINRLVGSLRIDKSYIKEILNWTPPISVKEGIRRMVQGK